MMAANLTYYGLNCENAFDAFAQFFFIATTEGDITGPLSPSFPILQQEPSIPTKNYKQTYRLANHDYQLLKGKSRP